MHQFRGRHLASGAGCHLFPGQEGQNFSLDKKSRESLAPQFILVKRIPSIIFCSMEQNPPLTRLDLILPRHSATEVAMSLYIVFFCVLDLGFRYDCLQGTHLA